MDYSIKCEDYGWWGGYPKKPLFIYCATMALIYPVGCPLSLFFYLWRLRKNFDPAALNPKLDEAEALKVRNEDETLAVSSVAMLALRHRPRFWWFEVYGMFRRLLLTSFALVFREKEDLTIWLLGVGIITTGEEQLGQDGMETEVSLVRPGCGMNESDCGIVHADWAQPRTPPP